MYNTFKPQKLLVLFASCSLLLTSCYPSGGELLSTEDNDAINDQIENIISNNEDLDVEVTFPAETVAELPKINVGIMEWNDDSIKDIFLSGKENLEYKERDGDIFDNEKHHLYLEDDAEGHKYWLGYEPGYLLSEIRRSSVFGYRTLKTFLGYAHLEDVFTDERISPLSKEDAIERCIDILKSVGITNYSEPDVYAVTVDKANKFWKDDQYDEYKEFKPWSSQEDEVYIMRFPIKYGDINVAAVGPNSWETYGYAGFFVGSYVDFVVTKDKIHVFDAYNIFSPEYETGDTVKINCSAENALKIAAEHYDNMSVGGLKYKIFDCNLVYVPHDIYNEKKFTLVPMWQVEAARYRDDDIFGIREDLFIDAETGKVIVW